MKEHSKKCGSHPESEHYHQPCTCDGYHTFDELYDHRITLFIALCKSMATINHLELKDKEGKSVGCPTWRSRLHWDGKMFADQFIIGLFKDQGKQITYHLPIERWDETWFAETLPMAPIWDAHTPDDVIARLKIL